MEGEDAADLEDSFVSLISSLFVCGKVELTRFPSSLFAGVIVFRVVWVSALFSRFLLVTYRSRKFVIVVSFYLRILHLTL